MIGQYSQVWQTELPPVGRPVLDLRLALWNFVDGIEIGKQGDAVNNGDADQYMPEAVKVAKIDPSPKSTKEAITKPT